MNRKKWPQTTKLCAFNDKLYIKFFFYKYLLMYIIRHPLLTSKKCSWGYTYTLIVEKYC